MKTKERQLKKMDGVLEHVSNRLKQEGLRHEIHKFDSGAVMVDIWKDDLFYVVQIHDKTIGLSLVTADTGFDATPDKSFTELNKFFAAFETIFQKS